MVKKVEPNTANAPLLKFLLGSCVDFASFTESVISRVDSRRFNCASLARFSDSGADKVGGAEESFTGNGKVRGSFHISFILSAKVHFEVIFTTVFREVFHSCDRTPSATAWEIAPSL